MSISIKMVFTLFAHIAHTILLFVLIKKFNKCSFALPLPAKYMRFLFDMNETMKCIQIDGSNTYRFTVSIIQFQFAIVCFNIFHKLFSFYIYIFVTISLFLSLQMYGVIEFSHPFIYTLSSLSLNHSIFFFCIFN